jgi:hypothetical protein
VTVDHDLLLASALDPPPGYPEVAEELAGELLTVLQREMPKRLGEDWGPVTLRGQYSNFAGTNNMAVLLVDVADGRQVPVVWKDLSPCHSMTGRPSKPGLPADPRREILAYDRILGRAGPDVPACYAVHSDPGAGRYWLFLEQVPSTRLPLAADPDAWIAAARCLGRVHRALAVLVPSCASIPAVRYDAPYFLGWLEQALQWAEGTPVEKHVRRLADRHPATVERLARLPVTVLHGEAYPVNVVVSESGGAVQRICFVDWETVGLGPALLDVAALTSGAWDAEERAGVVAAYLASTLGRDPQDGEIGRALDAVAQCRIHLCIKWMVWKGERPVPEDQAHDWLDEAILLSQECR